MDLTVFAFLAGMWLLLFKYARRKIEALERERRDLPNESLLENQVAEELEQLPDGFRVFHHLTSPLGNIDHIVIGTTGVFALNVKAWKGVVTSDGQGELLWNQHIPDEPVVQQFVECIQRIEEKATSCLSLACLRFEAVLVFTAAKLQVGRCNRVYCIHADQLRSHILASDAARKLTAEQIDQIASGLCKMAK